ncbi:MAG: ribosome assembly cofactor RimP [Bacteroidales bacterium]|nr:ribosome assembly cofactor RimP [Bacteroidales bacterium]
MIKAALIRSYLEEELTQNGKFLVDVTVSTGNKIVVYMDSLNGVTLDECIQVSRYLESKLDREVEDYELEVSSPGLDKPLKLPVQYEKNLGRMLEVVKTDGNKVTGKLAEVSPGGFIRLESESTVKDSKTGKKKKEPVVLELKFDEIKTAKVIISLKK